MESRRLKWWPSKIHPLLVTWPFQACRKDAFTCNIPIQDQISHDSGQIGGGTKNLKTSQIKGLFQPGKAETSEPSNLNTYDSCNKNHQHKTYEKKMPKTFRWERVGEFHILSSDRLTHRVISMKYLLGSKRDPYIGWLQSPQKNWVIHHNPLCFRGKFSHHLWLGQFLQPWFWNRCLRGGADLERSWAWHMTSQNQTGVV